MSERQQIQAVRVAHVSADAFARQVESEKPPTITQLAQQGIRRPLVDLKGRDPKEFNRAMHFVGDVEYAARTLRDLDVGALLPLLNDSERAKLRAAIAIIDSVTDSIITRI